MSGGTIKAHPTRDWSEEERAAARFNCAARCRGRGDEDAARSYEAGANDAGWAMIHEVARLRAEKGAAA